MQSKPSLKSLKEALSQAILRVGSHINVLAEAVGELASLIIRELVCGKASLFENL